MIYRFEFGKRIITDSVIKEYQYSNLNYLNHYFDMQINDDEYNLSRSLNKDDKIYGLGENVKGINKRGCMFKSFNEDDPDITEDRTSLYASHNFLIISSVDKVFGVFIDTPRVVDYDLGFTNLDKLVIKSSGGFDLYIIEEDSELDVIKSFREMINNYDFFAENEEKTWGELDIFLVVTITENPYISTLFVVLLHRKKSTLLQGTY